MKLSDLLSEVAMEYLAHPEADEVIRHRDGHTVISLYVQLVDGISEDMAVQVASVETSTVEDGIPPRQIWGVLSFKLLEQLKEPEPRAYLRLPEATKQ